MILKARKQRSATYLEAKGIEQIGQRDVPRSPPTLLGRVADARSEPLSAKTAQLIASYVAIVAPARASARRIQELATLMGIQIEEAVGAYEWRLELMAQSGLDLERRRVFRRLRPGARLLHRLRLRSRNPRPRAPQSRRRRRPLRSLAEGRRRTRRRARRRRRRAHRSPRNCASQWPAPNGCASTASASRRSGIGVEPAWPKPMTCRCTRQHALAEFDHADGLVFGLEDRPLFDMNSETGEFRTTSRPPRRTCCSSAFRHRDALGILPRQYVVGGEVADIGRGRHHGRREARAFIGPVADADRRLGFDAGIVERAHHFSAASVPSTPSYLPPVGCVSRWEPRPSSITSRPLRRPNIEPSVSTWTEARGLAGAAEPVAHLLVFGAEGQLPHANSRRGAELAVFVKNTSGGIDLQVGGDFGHGRSGLMLPVSMTRWRRRVNNGASY